jgi:hypothetical protein
MAYPRKYALAEAIVGTTADFSELGGNSISASNSTSTSSNITSSTAHIQGKKGIDRGLPYPASITTLRVFPPHPTLISFRTLLLHPLPPSLPPNLYPLPFHYSHIIYASSVTKTDETMQEPLPPCRVSHCHYISLNSTSTSSAGSTLIAARAQISRLFATRAPTDRSDVGLPSYRRRD